MPDSETLAPFYGSETIEVYDGHTDSALCLRNIEGYVYRIGTLPLTDDSYVFTMWAKAMSDLMLFVNMLGVDYRVHLTAGEWTKIEVFNETPDKDAEGVVTQNIDVWVTYDITVGDVNHDLYLYRAMLEKSNHASDWRPAPEDNETDILQLAERMASAELLLKDDRIVSTVMESETYKSSYETLKQESKSAVEQLSDSVEMRFDEVEEKVSGADEYIKTSSAWQRFDADGIHLGRDDSQFTMDLSNQELAFNDNGNKVAYINDQTMHITNAEVLSKFAIGKFAFVPTETGMALIYIG